MNGANGIDAEQSGAGAGGSIVVRTFQLRGRGSVVANGGTAVGLISSHNTCGKHTFNSFSTGICITLVEYPLE